MSELPRLSLVFGEAIDATVRRRVSYAYRVFCAVYGFRPVEGGDGPRLCYGLAASGARDIALSARYVARAPNIPAPGPQSDRLPPALLPRPDAPGVLPCFHGRSGAGPDWLGEIFEWISGADDLAVTARDSVGRVPYENSLHERCGLDPTLPYAGMAMFALNRQIRQVVGDAWPDGPVRPWQEPFAAAVVATHDIDFLPLSRATVLHRWLKNAAIAALGYHDPALVLSILWSGVRGALRGRSPLDGLAEMCRRERAAGMRSTCTVICRRGHRRDANYDVDDPRVRAVFDELARAGVELGVHGSYTSLDAPGRLAEEYARLAAAGHAACGGRQHWLRYAGPALFDELRRAGAAYDCTVGHATRSGFRHGACFPYPPYDFAREEPYPFLELPLVLMDVTLYEYERGSAGVHEASRSILDRARLYGWGGVSVLWHDTVFGGAQLPRRIGDLYWRLKAADEQWMGGRELVERVRAHYEAAGLTINHPSAGGGTEDA